MINESVYTNIKEYYKFVKDSQFCEFGYATDFRRENINQDINVSFLGSVPVYSNSISDYFTNNQSNEIKNKFFEELEKFKNNPLGKFNYELDNFTSNFSLETLAIWLITSQERFSILSELIDIGLRIYGYSISFTEVARFNYKLLAAFNYDVCVTQEQSQRLYNRSKLSLNLPNARATLGFSWRVPDILATQSVLCCNKKDALDTLLKGYIELPQYESPAEAKELAKKLLNDDKWREEISLACNRMIEDKCRFELKFKNIQDKIGIKLLNESNKGKLIEYTPNFNFSSSNVHNRSCCEKVVTELTKCLPYFIAKKLLKD